MKHNFYANHRQNFLRDKNRSTFSRDRPDKTIFSKGNKNKFELSIEDRVSELLKLYEDFPTVRTEIIGNFEMFLINRNIARELKSSTSEKKLTRDFTSYIKNLKTKYRKDLKI